MFFSPRHGFFVQALDVLLELLSVHAPHPAAPDLDGRQLSRTHERINLGDAHTQIFRHVVQGEKSRLDLGHRRSTIAADEVGYLNLKAFALVWPLVDGGDPAWR